MSQTQGDNITANRPSTGSKPLHIAMVGQKGLPATFGGIERHVEEMGARLAQRGHRVTVYCRPGYSQHGRGVYRGMELVPATTFATKHMDTIVHSFTSTVKATLRGVDIVHYHALGPGLVAPIPRYLSRSKVVLTVHGLDHERAKWGGAARAALALSHELSGRVPDRVVTVSKALQQHYGETFGRRADYITNGVPPVASVGSEIIEKRFGLRPGRYVLFVGRLVPEKRPDLLIEAFRRISENSHLVLAGDSAFTDGYSARLRELAGGDPRIVFTGFVYGETLAALYQHCRVFVQPSEVEGLPLTLLEAIAQRAPVLVSDIQAHREVVDGIEDAAVVVPAGDGAALETGLRRLLAGPAPAHQHRLRDRVLEEYAWDRAVDRLETVYREVTG